MGGRSAQEPSSDLADVARARPSLGRASYRPDVERFVEFGGFTLDLRRRVLLKQGNHVRLGDRALNILITLVEAAGEVVGKEALMASAEPGMVASEVSLRSQISVLRRALDERESGERFISNLQNRGYCFVARVENTCGDPADGDATEAYWPTSFPGRVVGRDEIVREIAQKLRSRGFVTIVGGGGMGKTTVAVAVAKVVARDQPGGICFVNLAPLEGPAGVRLAVASALGMVDPTEDARPEVEEHLRDRRLVIVLDNCEHVIDDAAELAEAIRTSAPGVLVLTTSREPLRAADEWVHRLPALALPDDVGLPTFEAAVVSPAVQLFCERAMFHGNPEPSRDDVVAAGGLCRRLGGVPLALELAAAQVESLGLGGTIAMLSDHLLQFSGGRRTASHRHRTLRATLDWSYGLLDDRQKAVLDRLSVFPATFELSDACRIAVDVPAVGGDAVDVVASLVSKSLVNAEISRTNVRYSLSESTRSYGRERLVSAGRLDAVRRCHAETCLSALGESAPRAGEQAAAEWVERHRWRLDDIRTAVRWCGLQGGLPGLAFEIIDVAKPLFTRLGLLFQHRALARSVPGPGLCESAPDLSL